MLESSANGTPPLVMLALILTVWQILCMKPGATLPAPTKIWSEAYDLIVDPFFVAGLRASYVLKAWGFAPCYADVAV